MCYVHISSCYAITMVILLLKLQHGAGLTKRPVSKQCLVLNRRLSAKQEIRPPDTYQGRSDTSVIFAKQ